MPIKSVAKYAPGKAEAFQSPYVVGPIGGMGDGSGLFRYMSGLLERQMQLKEAMMKAQLYDEDTASRCRAAARFRQRAGKARECCLA